MMQPMSNERSMNLRILAFTILVMVVLLAILNSGIRVRIDGFDVYLGASSSTNNTARH
jgi:hypothetical protein